ncbi:MAG: hypothetical protein IT329_01950 [Caldilineaceae bacterium]|nr:hypothetical protein [Caldilineaceae bacterium]
MPNRSQVAFALFWLLVLTLAACGRAPTAAPTAAPTQNPPTAAPTAAPTENPLTEEAVGGKCQVYAVELVGAWVEAGAPESDAFEFTPLSGPACVGAFEQDILPLFTRAGAWFEGALPCTSCHFANSEESAHEMDLSNYAGILAGADVVSEPPGEPIITPGDWEGSALRARLRNNRMPPGWTFIMDESNRTGPCLRVSEAGVAIEKDAHGRIAYRDCESNAVGLIAAWVDAGAPEKAPFSYGGAQLSFERDVLPFFTQPNMWFEGSPPCIECHFANNAESAHEMNLDNYAGILAGADVVSSPPGEPIITPGDWEGSALRARLRNNRMPPGWTFMRDESNRDGPIVEAGQRK